MHAPLDQIDKRIMYKAIGLIMWTLLYLPESSFLGSYNTVPFRRWKDGSYSMIWSVHIPEYNFATNGSEI